MVAINQYQKNHFVNCFVFVFIAIIFFCTISFANAAVMPEERVDILSHVYNGGGIQVSGPSVLVRKSLSNSVSLSANYYVDVVSSASIDVIASASRYIEKRNEKSVNLDYLHDRTTFSVGFTDSFEKDYASKTYSFGLAQTFFGDLTTLGFGFSFGQDVVGRNIKGNPDPNFHLDKERRKYTFSLSQIITKNLITDLSIEAASDACIGMNEGESCMNNPYRQVRYITPTGLGFQSERYPLTHNSDAVGLRAMYHLPYRATLRGDVRQFSDSWGVTAKNAEMRYTQELTNTFLVELKYRVYSQTAADFYSDLFPYKDAQNFLARDKELSPFSDKSVGVGVTYRLPGDEKSTVNFYWDHMQFTYDDFRDYKNFMKKTLPIGGYAVGQEPLYNFDANIFRVYLSFWF